MDYKIKFEYKGIGKQAAGLRQKVLQAQKATGKTGITGGVGKKESISGLNTPLKTLNSSILKLIASNKDLSKNISGKGPSRPSSSPGGMPSSGGGGKSSPFKNAAVASLGFAGWAISKINQVGNAYIEKVAQQSGNVGTSGFRGSQGMYMSNQMGSGMKAYSEATGKFQSKVVDKITDKGIKYKSLKNKGKPDKTALDVGAIYGLSADETLRTAGQFKRAGASYKEAAQTGAGMGIETELPMLLTGMANILTDAVREGVNTSDMSKDMAKEISSLTMATPGKSVDAALNIIKSFSGTKKQLEIGKVGGSQGLFGMRAAQQLLMEKLTGKGGKEYRERLEKTGFSSIKQTSATEGLKKGDTFQDLMKAAPNLAYPLLRKFTEETGTHAIQKRTISLARESFGNTPEGKQKFYDFATQQGWGKQSHLENLMRASEKEAQEKEIFEGLGYTEEQKKGYKKIQKGLYGDVNKDVKKEGAKKISDRAKAVKGSASGRQITRLQQREALMFKYGDKFAETSMKMEKQMLNLADGAAPLAVEGLVLVGKAATGATDALKGIEKWWKKLTSNAAKGVKVIEEGLFD